MLVTSRETGRWVLPKGWVEEHHGPAQQAAREAFEEAGIKGRIAAAPLGRYAYPKRLADGTSVACEVEVFTLEVERLLASWPEQAQRQRRWFTPAEAADAVQETELSALLRSLVPPDAG